MKMLDGRAAQIEWNDDDKGRVTELVVFDRVTATPEEKDRSTQRYEASHGACVIDWMSGERAVSTPEGQFISRVRDGFASDEALLNALDQFGQIREAGWARTMGQALRERLVQEHGDPDVLDYREDLKPASYDG